MQIDPKEFRRTVGHFVTGVTVIAADIDRSTRGMTANAFASLSLDPPLVLFCVAKKAHLGQVIHMASGFSVNILTQEQENLSTYFAGGWKGATPPPLTFEPWEGGPMLTGSSAAIGCAIDIGTVPARLYEMLAPRVTGQLAYGAPTYDLEIWLASALLGVTFPFLIFYAEFFKYWPLRRD